MEMSKIVQYIQMTEKLQLINIFTYMIRQYQIKRKNISREETVQKHWLSTSYFATQIDPNCVVSLFFGRASACPFNSIQIYPILMSVKKLNKHPTLCFQCRRVVMSKLYFPLVHSNTSFESLYIYIFSKPKSFANVKTPHKVVSSTFVLDLDPHLQHRL